MKTGQQSSEGGFTQRSFVRIVLLAIFLFTVGIYVNVVKHRGQLNMCMFNLGQIERATDHAAQDNNISFGQAPTLAAVNAYITGDPPACPSGGIYTYPVVGSRASCTIHGTLSSPESE